MILTGNEIRKQVENNRIQIQPFNLDQVNPNSYNFKLGKTIIYYKNHTIDTKKKQEVLSIELGEDGFILEPNRIYLAHTEEVMGSDYYVPIIRARSSTARLGLFVHITADLIDIGSLNQWTLQLYAVQPVKVYPGMQLGQVTFWETFGTVELYNGKYQGLMGPQESQIYKDFL